MSSDVGLEHWSRLPSASALYMSTAMTGAIEFVYRLATAQEWFIARETGVAPTREIDERDGYMHLSTRDQALETARIHFAGATDLLALEISLGEIDGQLKFELAPKRGEKFPHLYGALRTEHIRRAIKLVSCGDGFEFGENA